MSATRVGTRLLGAGAMIQHQRAFLVGGYTGTTVIPADNTLPQITEGTELLTVSITPKFTTSILRVTVGGMGFGLSSAAAVTMALFRDSTADAFGISFQRIGIISTDFRQFHIDRHVNSGSLTPTTFRLRIGHDGTGGTWYVNTGIFTGFDGLTMTVTEIA